MYISTTKTENYFLNQNIVGLRIKKKIIAKVANLRNSENKWKKKNGNTLKGGD